MFSKNLSEVLLRLIDEEGFTQETLAEACDLSPRFIGNVIRGHSTMKLPTFEKICAAVELLPNDLLISEKSRTPNKRKIMQVTQLFCRDKDDPQYTYPLCPNCGRTLEREWVNYCDRCGQRLGWKQLKNAEVIYDVKDVK